MCFLLFTVKFAGRYLAWGFFGREFHFTGDGGMRWKSRNVIFLVDVDAWSVPTRDRGYVVGLHGMISRYRIVRVTYTAKGVVDAPMMPASPK